MNVKNRHIVVIGGARSGVAAARLLAAKGASVLVTDSGSIPDENRSLLASEGIPFEEGGHSQKAHDAEFAVASPGVPDEAPIMQYYANLNRPIYSEIEVASWFSSAPILAVTGSNGKTTVTSWLGHLWNTADISHFTAGNIGLAFSDVVLRQIRSQETGAADVNPGTETAEAAARPASVNPWAILEVSSFQLDHIHSFRPRISCVLNITPDHLNRYQGDFNRYAASKMRILMNQGPGDVFICWNDDTVVAGLLRNTDFSAGAPTIWRFSSDGEVDEGIYVENGQIFFKTHNQKEYLMHVEEIGLRGRHNLHNGLAAALAARAAEIRIDYIRESLMKFEGVEHRLEEVRILDGVRYINDSKATNVNAVWYALDSVQVPMVLIMGGRDKGNDYSSLEPLVRSKVHTLIAIGEARAQIGQQLGGTVPDFIKAESLDEAVRKARKAAKRGEVVMLSPACASFDMFDSYEHRGREFKKSVNNL